jgi:flavin-dependent dehydrogenase
MDLSESDRVDVTVIGAGLAGLAASIHLAREGLRVKCIEGHPSRSDAVGESLDWSAPDLLKALGLPMEDLLNQGVATYKNHVLLKLKSGDERDYTPGEWLGKPPYNVRLSTIHVDRTLMDQRVRDVAIASGVTLIQKKVNRIETKGRKVTAVITEDGSRIGSPWFVDASGSAACLFPRLFSCPVREYGPRKVAIWDHFPVTETVKGTTLHADGAKPSYMEWVWQIPIHPQITSVGYVATAEAIKQKRQQGKTLQSIFQAKLDCFPDLRSLVAPAAPRTTAFRCRIFTHITGPNWLVIGESAAMVDPMTSNGVTAALRHAAEASSLIARYRHRAVLPWLPTVLYRSRVITLAQFFNTGIERVLYDSPIRKRIGPFRAGDVYTIPAWSLNAIYSRLRPRGVLATLSFNALVNSLRFALVLLDSFCRCSSRLSEMASHRAFD